MALSSARRTMMGGGLTAIACGMLAVGVASPGRWQAPNAGVAAPAIAPAGDYVAQDVMMPMRDGVRLHAQVWRPRRMTGPLPIMTTRSPYGFTAGRIAKGASALETDDRTTKAFDFGKEDAHGW